MVAVRWRGTHSLLRRTLLAFSPTRSAERTTNLLSIIQLVVSLSAYLLSLHRLYCPCNPPVL